MLKKSQAVRAVGTQKLNIRNIPVEVKISSTVADLDISGPKIIVPKVEPTLEWVLSSPPNVHQFEEPPVCFLIKNITFKLTFI